MKKEHKVRINQAIGLCEERFNAFDAHVTTHWPKGDAQDLRKFLLDNTVFAGGVFRSIFTKNIVKDIDVFFTSTDAAIEFQHRMMIANNPLFAKNRISANHTYNWGNGYGGAALSFITEWVDDPENLMRRFDFTFNQHYFNLNTYEMRFDADTFNKVGAYISDSGKSKHALRYYMRAVRFQQEGMQLTRESWYQIAKIMTGLTYHEVTLLCQAMSSNGDSQMLHTPELTGMYYTENDYFGVKKESKLNPYRNMTPGDWVVTSTNAATGAVEIRAVDPSNNPVAEDSLMQMATTGAAITETTMDVLTGQVTTRIVDSRGNFTGETATEHARINALMQELTNAPPQGIALNAIAHPTSWTLPEQAIGEILVDEPNDDEDEWDGIDPEEDLAEEEVL